MPSIHGTYKSNTYRTDIKMTLSQAINAAQLSANRNGFDYVVFRATDGSSDYEFVPKDAAYSIFPGDFVVHPLPDHLRKSA